MDEGLFPVMCLQCGKQFYVRPFVVAWIKANCPGWMCNEVWLCPKCPRVKLDHQNSGVYRFVMI